MKKIIFGFVIGFMLTLGINVNAAEISGQLTKMIDTPTGGSIQTLNNASMLNVNLGSESGIGTNMGGTLILYNGGKDHARVAATTNKANDAGLFYAMDKSDNIRVSMKAYDTNYGPMIQLRGEDQSIPTFLTTKEGYIDSEKIVTENFLEDNYISKVDVQKVIDDAVQKALSK